MPTDTMIETFILSVGLIGLALLLMCVRMLLKRGGTFHAQHVGQSKAMRERGIGCVQGMDARERAELKRKKLNIKK